MDCFTDPAVLNIVLMCSSQVMKTEIMLNMMGYTVDCDPGPSMFLNPTLDMADAASKERFAPMVRDTPALRSLIDDSKSKTGTNNIRHKTYPGGFMAFAGANSPASLAARPIRYLFADEIDRYPASAGREGSPIKLATRRTQTFWNRKMVYASTPTIKGMSAIERLFESSDQRHYYIPCPECGHMQTLRLGGTDCDYGLVWDTVDGEHIPESVWYRCEANGCRIEESDKHRMLTLGEWRPHAPFKGSAGFKISALYSPWKTWAEVVAEFLEEKKLPETFKTFVNTILGELWEEKGDTVSASPLMNRREHYNPRIPDDVLLITAGVDTQDNRLVVRINGYGVDWEQWLLEYLSIPGDPAIGTVWKDLDRILALTFTNESGVQLRIISAFIDSGGHRTQDVYDYVQPRQNKRIFAIKGSKETDYPVVKAPTRKNKKGVSLYMVGPNTAKDVIYSHLKIEEPGPGYCHFPFKTAHSQIVIDEEFFKEQTAEKAIKRWKGGNPVRVWEKVHTRNEALDTDVYAYACARNLNPNWGALAQEMKVRCAQSEGVPAPVQPRPRGRRIISKGVS